MAGSVNKVTLIGNLGADPEIRRTQDGRPIANLRVATSDRWRDKTTGELREKTEWHRVVIFNEGLCKIVEQYLKKGSKVYLEGSLQTRPRSLFDRSGAAGFQLATHHARYAGPRWCGGYIRQRFWRSRPERGARQVRRYGRRDSVLRGGCLRIGCSKCSSPPAMLRRLNHELLLTSSSPSTCRAILFGSNPLIGVKRMRTWPRWSALEVKDWQDLYVVNADGEKTLNAVTSVLINYTVPIGVREISEQNIDDVFCRIAVIEAVIGSTLLLDDKPIFLTRDDVARHVGLRTEASEIPLREFWDQMCSINRRENSAGTRQANGDRTARSAMGSY